VSDIVSVEQINELAEVEQFALQFRSHGGLASGGQSGEPDYPTAMPDAFDPFIGRNLARRPKNVAAAGTQSAHRR